MWIWLMAVLSQSSSPVESIGPALTQIGIGALIAVPAYAGYWNERKERQRNARDHSIALDKKDAQIDALQLRRVKDMQDAHLLFKEFGDRIGPMLAEALKVSSVLPERFTQALKEASSARGAVEIEQNLHRLEDLVRDLQRERGG